MVDLVIIALMSGTVGAIVWGIDKRRHHAYGELLPAGIAVLAALLTWIITVAAGLSYQPGLTWIPWIASMVAAIVFSVAASLLLGRSRTARDTARLTAILRSH